MHKTELQTLKEKNAALQKQLDERNEATKVWIQADTQTREYANKLETALSVACEAFNEILGDINNACGSRPAWTESHQATLVHKTMVLAGKQRDAIEKIVGQRGTFASQAETGGKTQ